MCSLSYTVVRIFEKQIHIASDNAVSVTDLKLNSENQVAHIGSNWATKNNR